MSPYPAPPPPRGWHRPLVALAVEVHTSTSGSVLVAPSGILPSPSSLAHPDHAGTQRTGRRGWLASPDQAGQRGHLSPLRYRSLDRLTRDEQRQVTRSGAARMQQYGHAERALPGYHWSSTAGPRTGISTTSDRPPSAAAGGDRTAASIQQQAPHPQPGQREHEERGGHHEQRRCMTCSTRCTSTRRSTRTRPCQCRVASTLMPRTCLSSRPHPSRPARSSPRLHPEDEDALRARRRGPLRVPRAHAHPLRGGGGWTPFATDPGRPFRMTAESRAWLYRSRAPALHAPRIKARRAPEAHRNRPLSPGITTPDPPRTIGEH